MSFSLKSAFSKRTTGWTAVDAQGGLFGVTVDTSRKFSKKPRVIQNASAAADAKSKLDGIQQISRQLGDSGYPVIGLLDRNEYQIFLVDKAAVRAEEMLQSLRWTLSALLDYPSVDANIAWIDVPVKNISTPRPPQMYVVAAKRSAVDQRMDMFEQAHLRLAVMDVRETAQANLAELLESANSGVCLIYADSAGLQITITFQGELYLARFIRESLFDTADAGSVDVLREKFDRVALEVQRSLDFVRRNFPNLTVEGVFVAPTQFAIGLHSELSTRILTPIQNIDLSDVFEWPVGSELVKPEVQALYFNALAAALRSGQ